MNYLSYDIEIYNDLPDDWNKDFSQLIPSTAAICTCPEDVTFFCDEPYMTKETSQRLVLEMMDWYKKGFVPFTWNGLSFDFPLLASYSGMIEECAILALHHVDAMFLVVCHKGYNLGLDAALIGAGLETKTHTVTLNDKTVFSDMSGSKAPELWRMGEFDAVNTYLKGDVVQPLKLAVAIETRKGIRWTSKTGRPQFLATKLMPVIDALKLPHPNTSWMSDPKERKDYYSWIHREIVDKYLGVEIQF
jgi:hypothetical protein